MRKRIGPINHWPHVLLVTLLTVATASPQDSVNKTETDGFPNGRLWEKLTDYEKLTYLIGFRDGLTMGAVGEVSSTKFLEMIHEYYVHPFTYKEQIAEIDKLYADRENILLPVISALQYSAGKLRGDLTKAQLEQMLINMRKKSRVATEKNP
jgi:hypothetical protein